MTHTLLAGTCTAETQWHILYKLVLVPLKHFTNWYLYSWNTMTHTLLAGKCTAETQWHILYKLVLVQLKHNDTFHKWLVHAQLEHYTLTSWYMYSWNYHRFYKLVHVQLKHNDTHFVNQYMYNRNNTCTTETITHRLQKRMYSCNIVTQTSKTTNVQMKHSRTQISQKQLAQNTVM